MAADPSPSSPPNSLPRWLRVRQDFARTPPVDICATLAAEFARLRPGLKPGARIAVGVGSRGITNLPAIVAAVLDEVRSAGAVPFIIPAMGSHGGATPDGQRDVLAAYGITEKAMGVPIRASLEVQQVGLTSDGVPVHCSVEALSADGIIVVNRIKPHTDFYGTLGSGLLKMCVIGLGKRTGAAAMHAAATRLGHERAIRGMAKVLVARAPLVGGVAILENQFHETARLVAVPRAEMETAEDALLVEARALMPLLPFEKIDLLIVDWLGKNISGSGLDPNVTNRWVQGYLSSLVRADGQPAPFIRRIFVRGLTPESHGNAIGIGLADVTTTRLVREMDTAVTNINALTSLTPQTAKIPIAFNTDREAIERTLTTLALDDVRGARVVRIESTLSLTEMEVSEAAWADVKTRPLLTPLSDAREMAFDPEGNLRD